MNLLEYKNHYEVSIKKIALMQWGVEVENKSCLKEFNRETFESLKALSEMAKDCLFVGLQRAKRTLTKEDFENLFSYVKNLNEIHKINLDLTLEYEYNPPFEI